LQFCSFDSDRGGERTTKYAKYFCSNDFSRFYDLKISVLKKGGLKSRNDEKLQADTAALCRFMDNNEIHERHEKVFVVTISIVCHEMKVPMPARRG